jgi:hypothetical protein
MSKNIAVKGCTVQDMTGGGTAKIESDPNASIKCNGKNAYFGTITVSVKGSNGGGFINNKNGQGVGTIKGTGAKILGGNQPAVVEGDTGSVSVTGTNTVGNVTTTVTKTVTVKITAAGQAKVVAL